jgi:Xaa-Pro aminopeptidase
VDEIAQQLERRRDAAAAAWNLGDESVLIGAGDPVAVPGRYDLTYPFRSHSEYFYLTDRERPGGVLTFDPSDGWTEFVEPATREELLWTGTDDLAEGVPEGTRPRDELAGWLDERRERRIGALGAPIPGAGTDPRLDEDLRYALNAVRRAKDDVELARMRTAEQATRAGFESLHALIREGRTERELQIELEAAFFRHGADTVAYETIVGGGPHAAVLHFAPTNRPLGAGEVVLIDAGGEYRGYASDVTRTYPVSGTFSPEQQAIHDVVRNSLEAGVDLCRPGVEWRDVHRSAALVIGEGLVELGILRGEPESLFEQGAITLFFPHGVGHMVGLGIRDAGGIVPPDREPPGAGYPRLRVDLPLAAGYTLTVEPGLYFIRPLLDEPATRAKLGDAVDWARVDRLRDFGGVRLEQNVLVTSNAPDVLTADIPL